MFSNDYSSSPIIHQEEMERRSRRKNAGAFLASALVSNTVVRCVQNHNARMERLRSMPSLEERERLVASYENGQIINSKPVKPPEINMSEIVKQAMRTKDKQMQLPHKP
ncbi:MAG: hypothetical protein K2K21_12105 [Lachnospiraceae bacterium]|nr:hypothetical protein [Lachnospiraceae bacterium]